MESSGLYFPALLVHSWLRWLIVALTLVLLVRCARYALRGGAFAALDDRLHTALVACVDLQLLVGLGLYFVWSPIVQAARLDMASAMQDPSLRFFVAEHFLAMVVAVVVLHVGRVRVRRADDAAKHARALRWLTAFAIFVALGIPWPFLAYGRQLFPPFF